MNPILKCASRARTVAESKWGPDPMLSNVTLFRGP